MPLVHNLTARMRQATQGFANLVSNNPRAIVFSVALVLFVWLMGEVNQVGMFSFDVSAYKFFVLFLRRPWLTPIMQSISELALPVVLLVMLLAVEVFAPGRKPGMCATVNLVGIALLNLILKEVVQRPRPDGFRLIAETGYSFPSGHSMVSMGFYGLLAWMVWHYEKDRFVKWLGVAGFGTVVLLVGLSRVYLGVHYASDVIAGFCVSLAWLCVYTKLVAPLFLGEHGESAQT